jgi:hypothetical protein
MKDQVVINEISTELGISLKEKDYPFDKQLLADKINELVNTQFQKLVSILYRMDVSETKLKQLLSDNPGTDAGLIIADLMIERQKEKIRSRQQFSKPDENISDDEKW